MIHLGFEVGQRRVALDHPDTIAGRGDRRQFLGVVFVLDLAHDLLEHVLEGHDPAGPAILVDDDDQMAPATLEIAELPVEPFGLGHELDRPDQWMPVARVARQQILGVNHADDVVGIALDHQQPRMLGHPERVEYLRLGRRKIDRHDVEPGGHDLFHRHIGQAEDAGQPLAEILIGRA